MGINECIQSLNTFNYTEFLNSSSLDWFLLLQACLLLCNDSKSVSFPMLPEKEPCWWNKTALRQGVILQTTAMSSNMCSEQQCACSMPAGVMEQKVAQPRASAPSPKSCNSQAVWDFQNPNSVRFIKECSGVLVHISEVF